MLLCFDVSQCRKYFEMRVFENMIVNLITTVYNFLWGDSAPGRRQSRNLPFDSSADPNRHLFYDPDTFSSYPSVPGHDPCPVGKEK